MLAPTTHILPLTAIRRARLLPHPGRVLVRTGQKVSASEVIAETNTEGQHVLLNVRRSLGILQPGDAERAVAFRVGDPIQKGDIIAETEGILPRVLRSPVDGQVVSITGGSVMIETQSVVLQVKAGFNGMVTEIIADRGAVVANHGLLVQGMWGNRQVNSGLMINLSKTAEDELTSARLDVSMRGAVILTGHCGEAAALHMANDLPLRGLILGTMKAELIPVASSCSFPIIVIDGFGKAPMNAQAYRILSTNEKREACLNAMSWNTATGDRPEIVIPLPSVGEEPPESVEFTGGQTVRICVPPYIGQVGVIEKVNEGVSILPNGLHAETALVRLQNDQRVVVPLVNLDVLE